MHLSARRVPALTREYSSPAPPRQLDDIADELSHLMKRHRRLPLGQGGRGYGHWLVVDCGDFVVHLFAPGYRETYDLDLLWGDAERVEWRL